MIKRIGKPSVSRTNFFPAETTIKDSCRTQFKNRVDRKNRGKLSILYYYVLILIQGLRALSRFVVFRSDQKIYVTVANACLSLRDHYHEVAVVAVTGMGTSYEARNAVAYQKLSFKIDTLMLEGCNLENDLVSVLKLVEEPNPRGELCDNPQTEKRNVGKTV